MEGKDHQECMISAERGINIVIVLFHLVGLAGFLIPALNPLFIALVPWHILLMFVLLMAAQQDRNIRFVLFVIIAAVAGFVVEIIGVSTGEIFGRYGYGLTLGVSFQKVPLVIGLNWAALCVCAGTLVSSAGIKNIFVCAAAGAAMMAGFDWLMEPVAIRYDYWEWQGQAIPVRNYLAWFLFSFLLLLLFYRMRFKKENTAALTLLASESGFFAILNLAGSS